MRAVKLIVCIAVSSVLLFLVLTMGVKPLFRSSANESTVGPKFVDPREHSLCQKFFTETCALPGWTPGEPYTKQDFFREVRKTVDTDEGPRGLLSREVSTHEPFQQ